MPYELLKYLFMSIATVMGLGTLPLTKQLIKEAPIREVFFNFVQPDNIFAFVMPLFEAIQTEKISLWLAYAANAVIFFYVYQVFRLAILVSEINVVTKAPQLARLMFDYLAMGAGATAFAIFDGFFCTFLLNKTYEVPELFSSLTNIAGAIFFLIVAITYWVNYIGGSLSFYLKLKNNGYIARIEREISDNPHIRDE